MSQRIAQANIDDYIKGRIIDFAVDNKEQYSRIFYFGIVINNNDTQKENRVKVRIPFLDDNFYLGRSKTEGDNLLPWCLPINKNFVSTPENNTIVLVAVMDPKTPYWGRIYFDSISDLSSKSLFDHTRLKPDDDIYNDWQNAEDHANIILKSKPKETNKFNGSNNIVYESGIRGKGKNRLTFDEDSTIIYQNEGTKSKQSLLKFTENIEMTAADKIDITSTKGGKKYHPLFDEPVYDYIAKINGMLKDIIQLLISTPSTNSSTMQPNLPSPQAPSLVPKLIQLNIAFNKLKLPGNGASKQITIN